MSDQATAQAARGALCGRARRTLNAMTTAVIAPDAHPIFHLMMSHLNAAVSRRRYPDERRSTRDIDDRHPAARGRDHLGTPRRNPGPVRRLSLADTQTGR